MFTPTEMSGREREGCERCVQDDLARSNSRWYPSIPCHCVLAAYLLLLFIIFIVFIYERRLYDPPAASTLTHRKIVDRWNVACNFELMFFAPYQLCLIRDFLMARADAASRWLVATRLQLMVMTTPSTVVVAVAVTLCATTTHIARKTQKIEH